MMQAGGGPPGEWSLLIVGHQWPSEMTISGLNAWIENRGQIASAHHNIADLLNAAKTGPLAVQEGKTADALVQLFDDGEQLAREIARKNGVKKDSYAAALGSVHGLRDKLSGIADRYNQEIKTILQSSEPAAVKVPQILAAIGRGQQEANLAAANCGGDIGDAGQRILDQEDTGQSFRQFAKANGIDMSQLFRSRDPKGLEPTVTGMLNGQGSAGGGAVSGAVNPAVSGVPAGGAGGGAVSGAVNPAVSGVPAGGAGGGAVSGAVNPAVSGVPAGAVGGGAVSGAANPGVSGSGATPAGFMTKPPGLAPAGPLPAAPPAPTGPVPPAREVAPVAHGGTSTLTPPPAAAVPPVAHDGANTVPPPATPAGPPVTQGIGNNPSPQPLPAPAPAAGPVPSGPSLFAQGTPGFGAGPLSGSPGMPFNAAEWQNGPPPSLMARATGCTTPTPGWEPIAGAGAVPPTAPDHAASRADAGVATDGADSRLGGLAFSDPCGTTIHAASGVACL
jgi:hypothetical protein